MPYNHSSLEHIRVISECLKRFDARARLDFETFTLEVRARGRRVELLPQFTFRQNGNLAYSPRLGAESTGFLGWRPYFNRVWPLSVDKTAFKEYCVSNQLPTPKQFAHVSEVATSVLIKRSRSSFGQGIVGPLSPQQLQSSSYRPTEGEFYEEFIHGEIAKIWFWNDKPVCLELVQMPSVVGDGHSAIHQLISKLKPLLGVVEPTSWDTWAAVVAYQGVTLKTVLPPGKNVIVDFRFQSPLLPTSYTNANVLASQKAPVRQQLDHAAKLFWNGIPEAVRQDTLYTVDAIVDPRQKLWFLEMNCNSLVHVDTYPAMFESLFGAAQAQGTRSNVPEATAAHA